MTLRLGPILGVYLTLGRFSLFAYGLLALAIGLVGVPGSAPLSPVLGASLGMAGALVLIVSYAAHELTHAIVARRLGMAVSEVRLLALPERSESTRREPEPSSGGAEALVAITGVLVSLVTGGLLLAAWTQLPSSADEGSVLIDGLLLWSAMGNLALAAINAVPAYPYDGGRLVRGVAWRLTGDLLRGTRIAAAIGRVAAFGLAFAGAIWAYLTGDLLIGLWLAAAGLFLVQASRRQYRRLQISRAVEGMVVSDVMDEQFAVVGPNLTIDTLFDQHERNDEVDSYPVTANGVLLGAIDIGQIRRVPRAAWGRTRVTDVMTTLEGLPTITGRESVMDALLRFDRSRLDSIAVVDDEGNHLVGLLTRDRLLEKLRPRVRWMANKDHAGSAP